MFDKIPDEMKRYAQWCVWRYEDTKGPKPTKVPYSPITGKHMSVTKPETWGSYEQALNTLQMTHWYNGLGFVLTEQDPYAFIDLDESNKDQETVERHVDIFNKFESYAERSPSGKGLHIIVKGKLPTGRKRSGVEIYSNVRYMTMTGDVFRDSPITDQNDLLQALYAKMSEGKNGSSDVGFYLGMSKEVDTDQEIIKKATEAVNGEKFLDLYEGRWEDYYASQSEADFALVDIVAFYTQNSTQIKRIFHNSALGQRDKAKRSDYVGYMLNKCFDRMLPPVDISGLQNKLQELIDKTKAEMALIAHEQTPQEKLELSTKQSLYSVPEGLVGEIAQYIYEQAPRPVPEIAIAGALGMMAGIVGRSYNISGTGLNQYMLLLAPTGTGKEAIASGISKLYKEVLKTVPAANEFIGPSEIASPQAITKFMSRGPNSFNCLVGEFGLYMQQMAANNAQPHLMGLRRFLLDVYNKSGYGKVLGQTIYSDKDKNTNCIESPAVSILGESTPERFYEGLHEGLISEGLLPRFTILEYHGNRPPLSQTFRTAEPSPALIEKIASLCAHSLTLNKQNRATNIYCDDEAQLMFDKFDWHCDEEINCSDKEVKRQLWNRAHIKSLKLAGLIAVGNNPYNPIISKSVAKWAIDIIENDVKNILKRFDKGEIGAENDEAKQVARVCEAIKKYALLPYSEIESYLGEGFGKLHSEKIIPYSYIQRKLTSLAVFRKDKFGPTGAIKRTLQTLIERGDLQEVSRAVLKKDYNTTAKSYMVSNPTIFGF